MELPSASAAVVFLVFFLSSLAVSDAGWCVCRSDQPQNALQKTLDYACGDGADCSAILQTGPCYNPNTVVAHCSYAANSYYQHKGQAVGSCDFTGTATITSVDPSFPGCIFPSSPSAATASGAASTTTTGTTLSPPGTVSGTGTSTGATGAASTVTGGTLGVPSPSGVDSTSSVAFHSLEGPSLAISLIILVISLSCLIL